MMIDIPSTIQGLISVLIRVLARVSAVANGSTCFTNARLCKC